MDIDRPHFRTTSSGSSAAASATTTSELFICFTSRLSSSSSMKLSKSILSPARAARDGGPTSLSSSHSRRLRTNGSLKGGQASPFFTTTGKKRGCAFENPEPSSPKVTCIGQVRVKTKKKVKQTRSLSKRRPCAGAGGEVSFRKIEQSCADGDDKSQQQQRYSNASAHYQPQQECQPHRNQRWVHLPISICEALREFSCLLPCKSSCFSTNEREKSEKHNGSTENGCGAVFARWLVSVNDGEGGKRREIELVVGGGDEEEHEEDEEEEERRVSMRTSRRHVFEDIEVKDDRIEMKGQSLEREEEEGARVSICVPPKNALLLMRCRSDPMKMAALTNRSTSNNQDQPILEEENMVDGAAPAPCGGDDGKDEIFEPQIAVSGETTDITTIEVEEKMEIGGDVEVEQQLEEDELEIISSEEMVEEMIVETEMLVLQCDEEPPVVEPVCGDEEGEEEEHEEEEEEEEVESNMSSFEDLLEQENAEQYEDCCPIQDEEQLDEDTTHLSPPTKSDEEAESPLLLQEFAAAMDTIPEDSTVSPKHPDLLLNNDEGNQTTAPPPPETTSGDDEEEEEEGAEEEEEEEEYLTTVAKPEENQQKMCEEKKEKEKERPLLPECLLLMMCEPKLSMEVSKETWVCSTDFTRWLPERPRRVAKTAKSGGEHEPVKRRLSIDSKTKPIIEKNELQQPPRSSCSLPMAAASMASMIEQKLVNAVAYEPFVLTRCKSEPMRTAAVKLMPESCFWKNAVRKMEPHRCAAMGVGAAGVGF